MEHRFIDSRLEFFSVLDWALERARQFEAEFGLGEGDSLWTQIPRQLEAMRDWTAAGRSPTKEERRSIVMGVQIVRELEDPPTPEVKAWMERLHELSFYFKHWLSDDEWRALDASDVRTFLPDTYAP